MEVRSRAQRDRALGKERTWGHHETVFAEVEESWCLEASNCKLAEDGSVENDLQEPPAEQAVAHRPVRGLPQLLSSVDPDTTHQQPCSQMVEERGWRQGGL